MKMFWIRVKFYFHMKFLMHDPLDHIMLSDFLGKLKYITHTLECRTCKKVFYKYK